MARPKKYKTAEEARAARLAGKRRFYEEYVSKTE